MVPVQESAPACLSSSKILASSGRVETVNPEDCGGAFRLVPAESLQTHIAWRRLMIYICLQNALEHDTPAGVPSDLRIYSHDPLQHTNASQPI